MNTEKRLDDLIEAGWHVIDSEFDMRALHFWKKKAYDFLSEFVGPDHASTQDFKSYAGPDEITRETDG